MANTTTTRRRKAHGEHQQTQQPPHNSSQSPSEADQQPLLSKSALQAATDTSMASSSLAKQPVWVVLAVASGACAAINGVFAKLTTTSLTSNLSSHISTILGLPEDNNYVNVILRGSFFGLNLLFNGVMWGLFTAALAKGNSTTRVSIVNVSANFFITAILGWLIFSEKLPLQWWLGAALLACGNVVIGRREEGEKPGGTVGLDQTAAEAAQSESLLDESGNAQDTADLLELDEDLAGSRKESREETNRLKRGEDVDAPL